MCTPLVKWAKAPTVRFYLALVLGTEPKSQETKRHGLNTITMICTAPKKAYNNTIARSSLEEPHIDLSKWCGRRLFLVSCRVCLYPSALFHPGYYVHHILCTNVNNIPRFHCDYNYIILIGDNIQMSITVSASAGQWFSTARKQRWAFKSQFQCSKTLTNVIALARINGIVTIQEIFISAQIGDGVNIITDVKERVVSIIEIIRVGSFVVPVRVMVAMGDN
jgi:hypothetical protein